MKVNIKVGADYSNDFKLDLVSSGISINTDGNILMGSKDNLKSITAATAWIALILSSTNIIINLGKIITDYVKKTPIEIEYEEEGLKLKFDSSTDVKEIEKLIKMLKEKINNEHS